MKASTRERAERELLALCHTDQDFESIAHEATDIIRRAVPFDGACWHTLDPATLIETGCVEHNLPPESRRWAEIEYLTDDFNQFAVLACRERHSGILLEETGGEPDRSARYRELIAPNGFDAELRTAFVNDGGSWGASGLLRMSGRPGYTADEAAFMHAVSPTLAQGFRRALLQVVVDDDPEWAPGLVLLDARDEIEAMTPPAQRWLDSLIDPLRPLPQVVYTVADRARRGGAEGLARARVQTRSGAWLVLHGAQTGDGTTGQTAVIVERAQPASVAPMIAQAYGLTERERQVTSLVLQGLSTKEIGAQLYISPYTVQQHLTASFDKVGVRSRRELVARLFSQQYLPRAEAGMSPGPDGWFAQTGHDREPAGSVG